MDIGACHPIDKSNSYCLEHDFDWHGILFDNDPGAVELCRQKRRNPVVSGDVTEHDWNKLLFENRWIRISRDGREEQCRFEEFGLGKMFIDYLSLDVDGASLSVLQKLPLDKVRFRFITAEHDMYSRGPQMRDAMRAIFKAHGYELMCADVCDIGLPFEDWWVDPMEVSEDIWLPRKNSGRDWKECVR